MLSNHSDVLITYISNVSSGIDETSCCLTLAQHSESMYISCLRRQTINNTNVGGSSFKTGAAPEYWQTSGSNDQMGFSHNPHPAGQQRPHLTNPFISSLHTINRERKKYGLRLKKKEKKVWVYKSGIVCPRKWFLKWHNFINRIWTINFILICFFDASCPRTKQGTHFLKVDQNELSYLDNPCLGQIATSIRSCLPSRKSHVILLKQAQRGLKFQLSKQFVDENPVCLWTAGCDTQDIFYNKD